MLLLVGDLTRKVFPPALEGVLSCFEGYVTQDVPTLKALLTLSEAVVSPEGSWQYNVF